MMASAEILKLGASVLADTGVPLVQGVAPVGDDPQGVEPFGEIDVYGALGVSARPWPADDGGHAEGVVLRDVAGADGVCVAARDVRAGKMYGALAEGDTCLHSTGPEQAALVLCKEKSRTVAMISKGSDGKNIIVTVNGEKDKIQIAGFGLMFEMSAEQGIVLSDGGATVQIKGGTISLAGTVVLGGRIPVMPVLGGTSPPGQPIPGVFVGI